VSDQYWGPGGGGAYTTPKCGSVKEGGARCAPRQGDGCTGVCGGSGAEKVKRGGAERGPRAQVLGSRCNFGARQPDDAKRAAVRRLLVAAGAHEGWGENWEWVAVRCPRPLRGSHSSLGAIGCSASPWRLGHCRPALPWSRVRSLVPSAASQPPPALPASRVTGRRRGGAGATPPPFPVLTGQVSSLPPY
jgi:hypothetical protein